MSLVFLEVLAAAHLEDLHLIAASVRHDGRLHLRARDERGADLDLVAVADEQDFSNATAAPTSATSDSTRTCAPDSTRYCLPPDLITAYIGFPWLSTLDLLKQRPGIIR
jgi:hypothetical protein